MEHNWDKYFDTSSKYWTKLQQLYKENDKYPKTKVRGRELHHKFLRCFSRIEGTEVDNDKENLVSLSCGDHFLAHYYIWKCTNTGYRRYTCRPVIFMYKKSLKYITDEIAELIAEEWSDVSKCGVSPMKGKKCSEETKSKMRAAHKGKKMSDESKAKMSALKKGKKRGPMSDETKAKLSVAATARNTGKHWKLVDGKRVWY